MALACALVAALTLLAAFSSGPLFDLLRQFALQLWIACAAALLVALITRRPILVALSVAGLAAGGGVLAAHWPETPDLTRPLKAISVNVWARNQDRDALRAYLQQENADVVIMVEARATWHPELERLREQYPWQAHCWFHRRCDIVLLSKWPVVDLHSEIDPATGTPIMAARIEFDGGPVTVIGTHLVRPILGTDLRMQLAQVARLNDFLGAIEGETLLLGDLNAVGWGQVVETLSQGSGLRVAPGLVGTWPSMLPAPLRIPIDHALATPGLVLERSLGPDIGSDHLPIVVRFARRD